MAADAVAPPTTSYDQGVYDSLVVATQVSSWPTAALPMENPCCSCKLTRLATQRILDSIDRVGGSTMQVDGSLAGIPSPSLLKRLPTAEGGAAE